MFLINGWSQNEKNVQLLSNCEPYVTCEDKDCRTSSNGVRLKKRRCY